MGVAAWLLRRQEKVERRRWRAVAKLLDDDERPIGSLYCRAILGLRAAGPVRGFAFLTDRAVYVTEGEQPERAVEVLLIPFTSLSNVAPGPGGAFGITGIAQDDVPASLVFEPAVPGAGREFLESLSALL